MTLAHRSDAPVVVLGALAGAEASCGVVVERSASSEGVVGDGSVTDGADAASAFDAVALQFRCFLFVALRPSGRAASCGCHDMAASLAAR